MNRHNVKLVLKQLILLRDTDRARQFDMAYYLQPLSKPPGNDYGSVGGMLDGEPGINLECGTAACLAGWAQLLLAKTKRDREQGAYSFAATALGLDEYEATQWFLGQWSTHNLSSITLDETIAFLQEQLNQEASP